MNEIKQYDPISSQSFYKGIITKITSLQSAINMHCEGNIGLTSIYSSLQWS